MIKVQKSQYDKQLTFVITGTDELELEKVEKKITRILGVLKGLKKESLNTPNEILDAVCDYYQADRDEVLTKSREHFLVVVRQTASYFFKKRLTIGLKRIEKMFGTGFDHSSVIYGYHKTIEQMEINEKHRIDVESIEENLNNLTKQGE